VGAFLFLKEIANRTIYLGKQATIQGFSQMATPIPTTCDLDFYISDVKTGRLSDLGQLSDAHKSVDSEMSAINKLSGQVAVFEISFVNTANLVTGFQFRLPLENLGLDSSCNRVLGVYGGFDGKAGQTETQSFRLYNKRNYIVGFFDPLVEIVDGGTEREGLGFSTSEPVLCYVVVGGEGCSFESAPSISTPLEDKNGVTDGFSPSGSRFQEASSSWFLFSSETDAYFESLIQTPLALAYAKQHDEDYDAKNGTSGGKIDIIDIAAVIYKVYFNFNDVFTNNLVPSYCCQDSDINNKCSSEVVISCVECFPSSQRSSVQAIAKQRGVGPFDCSEINVVDSVKAYCDQKDVDMLLNSEIEPYDLNITVAVSSPQTIAGIQFDLGYNVLDGACLENHLINLNPVISDRWSSGFISIEDRFGFDNVTRIAAFQKPRLQPEILDQLLENPRKMDQLHTANSLVAINESLSFVKFTIPNCLPKGAKCPEAYYVYAEDVNVSTESNLKEPGSLDAGNKYYGQVVKYEGRWWTTLNGDWTPSSLLLEKKWEGLEIFNIKVVTNEDRKQLQHEEQRLSYKGTELFYSQTIDTSIHPDYSSFYAGLFEGVYLQKLLYNGLDSNPEISAYNYLSSADATFAGYELDGNLDGKFDIADLIAFVNLGQMRMLTPFGDGTFDPSSSIQTTNIRARNASLASNIESFWKTLDVDNFLTQSQELTKIIPAYTCIKDFTTCTYPQTCPDIRSLDRGTSVVNISQRVDIEPDRASSATIGFLDAAPVGSIITLVDWNGLSYDYEFGSLVSGDVQVTIGTGSTPALRAADQASQFGLAILTGTGGISQDFSTPSTVGGEITITNNKVGERGNTKIAYTTDIIDSLSYFPSKFTRGSNYLSSLPREFKDWYRYFNDVHQISYLENTDIRLLENGGSFFEVNLCTNDHDLNFINSVEFTLNVCNAYYSGDIVKAFILADEAFNTFTVKDSGDNPIPVLNGFYSIPSDGIIKIECTESDDSIPSPAIMHDGGQFRVAKILLDRKPEFEKERTFELTASEINYRNKPRGIIDDTTSQLDSTGVTITSSGKVELGPVSSIYSQFYEDNSSSIHGYSDYTLHIEAVGEDVFEIIYNTKKAFRRFNFAIRTWNCAEFSSFFTDVGVPSYEGWTIEAENSISTTDDGYFVISGYSEPYSEPRNLIGNGVLCRVKLNKKVYENSVLLTGERFVCPPIGLSGDVVIPNLNTSLNGEKDYPTNWKTDAELTVFESQGTTQRFGTQSNDTSAIQLLDASKSYQNTIEVNSSDKVTEWIGVPGLNLVPHADNLIYAPTRGVDFITFDRATGQGLTTDTTTYLRDKNITSWMATLVVDPDMDTSSNIDGILVTNIGTNVGDSTPLIEIKIDPNAGVDSVGQLKATVEFTAPPTRTTTLTYDYRTLPADGVSMNSKQIITFTGVPGGDTNLYVNGTLRATNTNEVVAGLPADDDWGWAVGYDGITVPTNNNSKPYNGDFYEFIFYADSVTDEFRQLTEAYLALKFDLQTLLPTTHTGYDDGTGNSFTFLTFRNLDVESRFALTRFGKATKAGIKPGRSTKSGAKWIASRTCIDKKNRNLFNINDESGGV
jgi:hypothetical protein